MTTEEKQQAKQKTMEVVGLICDQFIEGKTLVDIKAAGLAPAVVIRWIIREMRWTYDWRKSKATGRVLQDADVIKAFVEERKQMSEIARNAGISRQRIEQILQEGGVDTMKQTAANVMWRHEQRALLRISSSEQNIAMREQAAKDKYAPWIEAWDHGATLNEMGVMFAKSPIAIAASISSLRHRYGWFPYRKQPAGVKPL